MRFCATCRKAKPPLTHHCGVCNRCAWALALPAGCPAARAHPHAGRCAGVCCSTCSTAWPSTAAWACATTATGCALSCTSSWAAAARCAACLRARGARCGQGSMHQRSVGGPCSCLQPSTSCALQGQISYQYLRRAEGAQEWAQQPFRGAFVATFVLSTGVGVGMLALLAWHACLLAAGWVRPTSQPRPRNQGPRVQGQLQGCAAAGPGATLGGRSTCACQLPRAHKQQRPAPAQASGVHTECWLQARFVVAMHPRDCPASGLRLCRGPASVGRGLTGTCWLQGRPGSGGPCICGQRADWHMLAAGQARQRRIQVCRRQLACLRPDVQVQLPGACSVLVWCIADMAACLAGA